MHPRTFHWVAPLLGSVGVLAVVLGSCNGGLKATSDDAGSDAAPCSTNQLRFRFVSTAADQFCIGAPTTCTATWLSIRRDTGEELVIDRPCVSDCTQCEPVACPASCAAPSPMRAEGIERSWDGTYWSTSTCGAATPCTDRGCAASARYFAKMCAYRRADGGATFCSPGEVATCTEVGFDWPPASATGEVLGVIRGDVGTECCPSGWLLAPCRYPDGGAGSNCHNPLLRCPISMVCGEGCDFAVARRCGE